jgi:pimeloyl-ACP methyl ester carboxylesterase
MSKHNLDRIGRFIIAIAISNFVISNSLFGNIGFNDTIYFVYSQSESNRTYSNTTQAVSIKDTSLEKVGVGDIDIAYKMFGSGDPILLISPAQGDMNTWDPSLLSTLSNNHTVIVFDNRGVGNTSTGIKPFSIQQFANDTAGLMNTLKVQNATVLGYSLGSFIAQQLAVTHPEKVNSLVLIASSCGGKESIPTNPRNLEIVVDMINKVANGTVVPSEQVKEAISLGLGSGWLKLHPNFLTTTDFPEAKYLFPSITPDNNLKQLNAGQKWFAKDWNGVCEDLTKISVPTLILTGTDDVNVPTKNSLIIAENIPGSWLVQMKNAGHQITAQYPDEINKILQTFLSIASQDSQIS